MDGTFRILGESQGKSLSLSDFLEQTYQEQMQSANSPYQKKKQPAQPTDSLPDGLSEALESLSLAVGIAVQCQGQENEETALSLVGAAFMWCLAAFQEEENDG
jgi:hypothetical protein